jgi:hypothetical protein
MLLCTVGVVDWVLKLRSSFAGGLYKPLIHVLMALDTLGTDCHVSADYALGNIEHIATYSKVKMLPSFELG